MLQFIGYTLHYVIQIIIIYVITYQYAIIQIIIYVITYKYAHI